MPQIRIADAARYLAVSDDTVRRLVDRGDLTATPDAAGRLAIDGAELASYLKDHSPEAAPNRSSARNRFPGLVTSVTADGVMAQVELQCGPFRVVSLMSSEAVRELGLAPGSLAAAVVKSTTVVVESEETS